MRHLLCLVALVCALPSFASPATAPTTAPARKPERVVFLLDDGGAMIGQQAEAVQYLGRQLDALQDGQSFGLIQMCGEGEGGTRANMMGDRMLSANARTKSDARQWLQKLLPRGGPNPADPLALALRMRPDRVVILATTTPRLHQGQKVYVPRGVRIDVVLVSDRKTEIPVGTLDLAKTSGGTAINLNGDELEGVDQWQEFDRPTPRPNRGR